MSDTNFVFALIAVAGVLMASNRVRYDVVALGVVLALMISGTLTVGDALEGFGQPVVIMVAGLLVVGEMLERTGIARAIGDLILAKGGGNELHLLVLMMASAALLGSVMSSTAIVAIFIPIVLRIAQETGVASRRLLLPMSYAALISGMLTVIATSPNLVVSAELSDAGFEPLGFFSFTPIGLAVLLVAIVYMVLVGRFLLPSGPVESSPNRKLRSFDELLRDFTPNEVFQTVEITASSSLNGLRISDAKLGSEYGARILLRVRPTSGGHENVDAPTGSMQLRAGDLLGVACTAPQLERLQAETGVRVVEVAEERRQRFLWEAGVATALIHPESDAVGKTLIDLDFGHRFGLRVFGVRRGKEVLEGFSQQQLQAGDRMLVVGSWLNIELLGTNNHDYVLLEVPAEKETIVPAYRKAPIALTILAGMIFCSVFDLIPLVAAVIIAAVAAVATGCLSADRAYRSIHWSSVVVIAGMLPLADALQQTGGSDLIVAGLLDIIGDGSPTLMMVLLFALTASLGLILSTTTSAVLVAPIAITAAAALGVSPYPFAIAVLIAASAAYSTPVSTPIVTLVVEPGRYAFLDFVKVGVPLLLLTGLVTTVLAPILFPF